MTKCQIFYNTIHSLTIPNRLIIFSPATVSESRAIGKMTERSKRVHAVQKNYADRSIPETILPEGYNGKILLASVSGDGINKAVLLRSGDLWHREILLNTRAEIKNLGYDNARVHELGGALVRFEPDGAITIYGASEEFGACDREYAAQMIKKKFPERNVNVRD